MQFSTKLKNFLKKEWAKYGLTVTITVAISSLITWGLISTLSAPKSIYASQVKDINNTILHMKDAATGLNNYAGYQSTLLSDMLDDMQIQLEELDSRVNGAENDIDLMDETVNSKASAEDLNNLLTTVNGKASISDLNNVINTVNTNSTDIATLDTDIDNISVQVTSLTITIPSGVIDANNATDRYLWTADAAYQVTKIAFQQSALESTSSSTTLMLEKVPSGTAIGGGSDLLSAAVNLKTGVTANTVLAPTLNSTVANLQFAAGNSLALDFTNGVTEYCGCITIVLKRI